MEDYAVPILPSRDLDETLGFYARLGFEERGSWPESGYLIVARGGVQLHFSHHIDLDPLTTAGGCYIYVADADALYRIWDEIGVPTDRATGSRLIAPGDTDYGMREFALIDRSGNLLRVGSFTQP